MNIPFPFAISFKKKASFSEFNSGQIEIITKKVKFHTVDISSVSKILIEFDVSFFRPVMNWNMMIPVDHGQVELKHTKYRHHIEYKVSLLRFIIGAMLMSTIMGVLSESFRSFLIALTFFLGFNWLIAWIRHNSSLNH